ncbi:hypothetical protein GCM10028864_67450 [Microlunatus parietis]
MADLVVELSGTKIGELAGSWRSFDFFAEPEAIERYGLDSLVLSVAVPLIPIPTRSGRRRRQNYFTELLPEGRMLDRLAQEAGVPRHDVIGMLRRYGRDIAGALQIWDPEVPGEPRRPRREAQTEAQVADLLARVQEYPLGNRRVGGKTSLAGVQDKIVLVRSADRWYRAIDGYPSTHILKPVVRDYPTMIFDEEFGSRFARALGLADFQTWLAEFEDVPALIIERYDRDPRAKDGRVHQEDFSQALGASGNEKYQKLGDRVSLARVARLLTELAGRESVERLLRLTVLSVALGNLDLHTKNLSLLHGPGGTLILAPAYDVVPQTHLPGDGDLALAVDHEYRHRMITREHLRNEAAAWGLPEPDPIIDDTLAAVIELAEQEQPHPRAHQALPREIRTFARNLRQGKPCGCPSGRP